jgi:hypothetical protein
LRSDQQIGQSHIEITLPMTGSKSYKQTGSGERVKTPVVLDDAPITCITITFATMQPYITMPFGRLHKRIFDLSTSVSLVQRRTLANDWRPVQLVQQTGC